MNILEQVAKWIGVGINKQFQVYDQEGNHVAAAVFKLDRSGCQLLATPKSDACIDPDTVLGGLISGNLVPKTRRLDDCPFCGGQDVLVQRMRFTRGGDKHRSCIPCTAQIAGHTARLKNPRTKPLMAGMKNEEERGRNDL